MHTRFFLIGALAMLFIPACSSDSASGGRDETDRKAASDHNSDSADPLDAAGRTRDNAGKCIAGACADQSPPTSP
jgi:hypothetical protein